MAKVVANDRGHSALKKCVLFGSLDEKACNEIAAHAMSRAFYGRRIDM